MKYTIRSVPQDLDEALRRRAREEGRSLNAVVIDALRSAEGLGAQPRRDLSWLAGTWDAESEVDRAIADQRSIDPERWSP
jgi:plasmid stability protein